MLYLCAVLAKASHKHIIKTSGNCIRILKKSKTSPLRLQNKKMTCEKRPERCGNGLSVQAAAFAPAARNGIMIMVSFFVFLQFYCEW